MLRFQVSVVSRLITVPSSIEDIGSLLPELIFRSWLELIKILFTVLRNSLQEENDINQHDVNKVRKYLMSILKGAV